jgi:DNA-directed RNA polymerase specialized sigma24 family protein
MILSDLAVNNSISKSPETTREQELIARVQRGQNELFYELVRPYERRVYAAALAILRNQTDAEDVAQEAMLKAFANIRQFRERLADALATLDRKYREVFVLRDMEQLNIQETAETLGISVASVKTRLLRARLMLRDLLAAGWEQGWFSRLPFEKGIKPW